MSAWDRDPSKEVKALSIENMKRLALVLSDSCYLALNAYIEKKKGKPVSSDELIKVMEKELDLVVEQNIEDESWREMIFDMALKKYKKQKDNEPKLASGAS